MNGDSSGAASGPPLRNEGRNAATAAKSRLFYIVNCPNFFISHRLPIAVEAKRLGYEVHVAAFEASKVARITECGLIPHDIKVRRGAQAGLVANLLYELLGAWDLFLFLRRHRPEVVHAITLKCILYAGVIGRVLRLPAVVHSVTGLGYLFVGSGLRARAIRLGLGAPLRLALRYPRAWTIFQNSEDRDLFCRLGYLPKSRAVLIRGSGVDTEEYAFADDPADDLPIIVLPSRMLWDKGVGTFVAAARIVNNGRQRARFALVGDPDVSNPRHVPVEQLKAWHDSGVIEWWGFRQDMNSVLARASIVCLPTVYREGVPKSLIEAASVGRPIITTDAPGCRDIVRHGRSGFLVAPDDAEAVARHVIELLENPELRQRFGAEGRRLVESDFALPIVVRATTKIYQDVSPAKPRAPQAASVTWRGW